MVLRIVPFVTVLPTSPFPSSPLPPSPSPPLHIMSLRFAALPFLCLFLLALLHPSCTTRSDALVLATADDAALEDELIDDDSMGMTVDDEDDVNDPDDDDAPATPEPDQPAVIDPKGEENASGYVVPDHGSPLFFDAFQDGLSKWTHTSDPEYTGRFEVGQGAKPTFSGDRALIIPQKARRYALSANVPGLDDLSDKDFVAQYEVKLDQGMTCGGAYIKLPTTGFAPASFDGSTTYSIMFGPDKCGATDKVHFIFQSKNPVTGKMTEHHMKSPPAVANTYDRKTHLYTVAVLSDGTFKVMIDGEVKKEGSLSDSFEPPVQPPKEIDDPDDKKPSDWVDAAKIPDPEATKPEDWDEDAPKEIVDEDAVKPEGWLDDEPTTIPDPEAKKPDAWDEEEDGEWVASPIPNPKCEPVGCGEWKKPMKKNPDYKGKWTAPMIDNPKYVGPWKPRKIPNKEYYEVTKPTLLPVKGVGFEIWTMDQGVLFDNLWIGTSLDEATKFADATFKLKQKKEIKNEEEENAALEKDSATPGTGKLAPILERVNAAMDTLERVLAPVETWLAKVGLEPYLDKLIDLGVEKPLLVVVASPIILVLLMLIVLGGKKKTPAAAAPTESETTTDVGAKKKTDEITPDDAVEDASTSTATKDEPESTIRKRRTAKAE